MKNKNLFIVSVLIIFIILVLSIFLPKVNDSDSAGTIGKVDKYRNANTGQEKVLFRNEFLKDTSALRNVINMLSLNANVLQKIPSDFENWENSLQSILDKDNNLAMQFNHLNELSLFLKNNLSIIAATRNLLIKYYKQETIDKSIDVENNLVQFSDFINNLSEKSKVLDTLFISLNGLLEKDKLAKINTTKDETEKLKNVRERMLGTIAFYAVNFGVQSTLNLALNSKVYNAVVLNQTLNSYTNFSAQNQQLNSYVPVSAQNKLNLVLNSDYFYNGIEITAKNNEMNATIANKLSGVELSNMLKLKELGIIVVSNMYYVGVKDDSQVAKGIELGFVYQNTAQSLGKIFSFPSHLAAL